MKLNWQRFTDENAIQALSKGYCLYVFHHPDDGDRPFYIGKAKCFGPNQQSGYVSSARYNAGYQHLVMGLLRAGFSVYIAEIGEVEFAHAEEYEQGLIARWNPVRNRKIRGHCRRVETDKPWAHLLATRSSELSGSVAEVEH